MRALVLALLYLLAATPAAAESCRSLIQEALDATKPAIVLEGDLEERILEDPNALHFVLVKGLPMEQSRVSASGQQIFLPPDVPPGAGEELLARLTLEAQKRRLAHILPGRCLSK